MLYNKLLAIRWIRLRVMSDDSDRKALMSNPDITRNLNAAEVEFALEESHGPITGELLSSEKESCRTKNGGGKPRVSNFPASPIDKFYYKPSNRNRGSKIIRSFYTLHALHYFPSFVIFRYCHSDLRVHVPCTTD